jgi:glucose/arabinose dehydrogenase
MFSSFAHLHIFTFAHYFCHMKPISFIPAICLALSAFFSNAQPVVSFTSVITGLSAPIDLVHAGDGTNRIFIAQQGGLIRVYDQAFASLGNFLTVTGISTGGERGLLSLVFHPDYETNGFFFVFYTNTAGDLEIARYKVSANPNIADPTKTVVLTIPHPGQSNHNGGKLIFGTDGYLYLSTGDGGGGGDVPNNAQNQSVLLGKLLRIAVNTSTTPPYYTVPAGNPFGNEIWALGLRNPFRWSFDGQTQDIWIGDVGQDNSEEIDFVPASAGGGVNYGWRCYEGNTPYNTSGCGPISNYTFPVHTYPTQNPSSAVTGGRVYRGTVYPAMQGYYIASDFYSGNIYKIISSGVGGWTISTQSAVRTGISCFGEIESGELYATVLTNGNVYRVEGAFPTGVGNVDYASGMRVYPNILTSEVLNVYVTKPWKDLEIISINGSVLQKQSIQGRTGRIDIPVNSLPSGTYLIRVSNNAKLAVQKVVIL